MARLEDLTGSGFLAVRRLSRYHSFICSPLDTPKGLGRGYFVWDPPWRASPRQRRVAGMLCQDRQWMLAEIRLDPTGAQGQTKDAPQTSVARLQHGLFDEPKQAWNEHGGEAPPRSPSSFPQKRIDYILVDEFQDTDVGERP